MEDSKGRRDRSYRKTRNARRVGATAKIAKQDRIRQLVSNIYTRANVHAMSEKETTKVKGKTRPAGKTISRWIVKLQPCSKVSLPLL